MRLIDADALMRKFAEFVRASNNSDFADVPTWNDAVSFVDSAPTIEAEKHGRWVYEGKRGRFPACRCSECGNVENADWAILGDNVNYCPHCGAKMNE